jgi:hypothetical protein
LFLDVHAHRLNPFPSTGDREHAAIQTRKKLSSLKSGRKRPAGEHIAQSAYFLTQTVQGFGTVCEFAAQPVMELVTSTGGKKGRRCRRRR